MTNEALSKILGGEVPHLRAVKGALPDVNPDPVAFALSNETIEIAFEDRANETCHIFEYDVRVPASTAAAVSIYRIYAPFN